MRWGLSSSWRLSSLANQQAPRMLIPGSQAHFPVSSFLTWVLVWSVWSSYMCSEHFTNRDVFAAQLFNSFHNVVSFLGWLSQIIISTWIHFKIYNFRYSYKKYKHIHFENLEQNFQKLLNAGHCRVENLLRWGLNFWICFKSYLGNSTIIFARLTN